MADKNSVWVVSNAEILPAKSEPKKDTDPVVSFTGKITKNGAAQSQKVLRITKAQRDAGVTIHFDPTKRIATIERVEKRAGRPTTKGIEPNKALDVLKALGFTTK